MARFHMQSARSVPSAGIFFRLVLFAFFLLFFLLLSAVLAAASAPPTGENAYCGKGNVPQFGDKDGPAELPKTCYYTGLDATPSPGKQIRVAANADLVNAVDGAKCGDTLLLPAGASYEVRT